MRTMDYISSCNLCYLVCDTLKLIDKRPVEHSMRVAYVLMTLLKDKGGYEDYEIAEFVFLAMLGDIGRYKTGLVNDEMDDETKEIVRNVYGALFLRNFSIFGERSNVLLYQHLPFDRTGKLNYKDIKISQYLYMIREFDKMYMEKQDQIDMRVFEEKAGKKYLAAAVVPLLKNVRMLNLIPKLKSGDYEEELREYLEENILFTNEEKCVLMNLIAYIFGLVRPRQTVETLQCAGIVNKICDKIDMTFQEKDKVYYAAIVHDMGMLAIPSNIVNKKEKLTREEGLVLQSHVTIAEKILRERLDNMDIAEISNAHHERLDGSGYPYHKKGATLTRMDAVLEASDMMVALINDRPQRPAMDKEQVLSALRKMEFSKALEPTVLDGILHIYDEIYAEAQQIKKDYLSKLDQTNQEFKLLKNSDLGERVKDL